MHKKLFIHANIPVFYLKEGDVFICYTPAFDLAAHGESFEDAKKSFEVTLELFIDEVSKKGNWEQLLSEYGWEKINNREWNPPLLIGQNSQPVKIPISV